MVTKLASVGGTWNSPIAMGHSFREGAGVLKRPVGEDQALGRCWLFSVGTSGGQGNRIQLIGPLGLLKHSRRSACWWKPWPSTDLLFLQIIPKLPTMCPALIMNSGREGFRQTRPLFLWNYSFTLYTFKCLKWPKLFSLILDSFPSPVIHSFNILSTSQSW